MIRIENVSKTFGGIKAVDQVSLEVAAGSVTGLIGPNGAGKTTLFNIVAGSITPDTGKIWMDNLDITHLPTHKLFHRGLVRTFQIPHEFTRMTVRENLLMVPPNQAGEDLLRTWLQWGRVRREEQAILDKVDETLEFLEITHVADELAGNLSGGQKKLLDLGRTMMTDARVVLLDEPGAGVNRTLLGKIVDAIERLNQERQYTFFVIEHDMDLITRLCDPVFVMANGALIAQGNMQEIRKNEQVREAYLGGDITALEAESA